VERAKRSETLGISIIQNIKPAQRATEISAYDLSVARSAGCYDLGKRKPPGWRPGLTKCRLLRRLSCGFGKRSVWQAN